MKLFGKTTHLDFFGSHACTFGSVVEYGIYCSAINNITILICILFHKYIQPTYNLELKCFKLKTFKHVMHYILDKIFRKLNHFVFGQFV